jgi:hypothetical protein
MQRVGGIERESYQCMQKERERQRDRDKERERELSSEQRGLRRILAPSSQKATRYGGEMCRPCFSDSRTTEYLSGAWIEEREREVEKDC